MKRGAFKHASSSARQLHHELTCSIERHVCLLNKSFGLISLSLYHLWENCLIFTAIQVDLYYIESQQVFFVTRISHFLLLTFSSWKTSFIFQIPLRILNHLLKHISFLITCGWCSGQLLGIGNRRAVFELKLGSLHSLKSKYPWKRHYSTSSLHIYGMHSSYLHLD